MGRKLVVLPPFWGRGAGAPSSTIWLGPRSTSVPSAILIHLIYNQHGERYAITNTENIKICGWITKLDAMKKCTLLAFSPTSAKKFEFLVSQGSVATCLRWDGQCHMGFVANFIRFPAAQKFWKSVKIWQSYRQLKGGNILLRHSVECFV